MKKLICLIAACLMLLSGCALRPEPKPEPTAVPTVEPTAEPVLPPVRNAGSATHYDIAYFDFESAYAKADIIALVRIGDWLGERNVENEIGLTYYSASVIEAYKGDAPEQFILCQDGNSLESVNGFTLFTYGDELLLYLHRYSNPDYEDMYYIVGAYVTAMYALPDASGELYLASLADEMAKTAGIEQVYTHDIAVQEELAANCSDPIVKDLMYHSPFICRASDYIDKLTALSDRQG